MKKLLYVSFILTLLITVFTLTATAATYGNLTYTVSNGEVTITDCSTSVTSVTIPEKINGYPVTSIGYGAFDYRTSLTSITIPDSVTSIGEAAFYYCNGLKEVHITNIAAWCSISFGNSSSNPLNYAKDGIFLNGQKPSGEIIVPDGVTNIPNYTFCNCTSITSITIPDSVTSIGDYAFSGCASLTSITIPDGVTSIGNYAFYNCGSLVKVNMSSESKLTSIGSYAFDACTSLTSITIPDSVTSIDVRAFNICSSLTSITIPDSVTSIGSYAFRGCKSLEKVHITDIAAWCNIAFGNEDANPLYSYSYSGYNARKLYLNGELVTDIIIPDSVTSIGSYAFYTCTSLTSITIPDSVTSIGSYAFRDCTSLTSITIPDSVTSIGSSAFRDCTSLTSITIPDSVTYIGFAAFEDCDSLRAVHITDLAAWCNTGFGSEDANPLYYANKLYLNGELVTDLVIPDGVTLINTYAFNSCSSITSVEFPKTITVIKANTFSSCSNLKKVIIPSTTTLIAGSAFSSSPRIYGFLGSEAEAFAELKGYTFVPLDEVVYEITYNLSGGEGQLETGKKGVYADYYITSTIPTKLHCTFLGWSTEEAGEVEYKAGDVYSANSDLTLFAVWQEPQLIAEDLTTSIGNEFTLPVVVKNNPGIAGMNLQITLPEGIELISVDKGTALSSLTMTAGDNLADSPYTILWDGETADTSNGTIVTLTLKVAKTASEGDYNVKIAVDAADKDLVDIEIPDVTVTVTAKNYIPGDSNGDNEVNFRDVIIIRSLIVNGLDSIDCNNEALDVNRDGELNFRDVILIRQYIVGGYGVVLK